MTPNKTKEGVEFEKALKVVRSRLEKQLRLNGKLKEGQRLDIHLCHEGNHGISTFNWGSTETNFFYPNGKFKF